MLKFENGVKVCQKCSTVFLVENPQDNPEESSNKKYWHTLVDKNKSFFSNDQVNPIKYYRQAIRDELKAPNMRCYDPAMSFIKYLPIVYRYYFEDCHYGLKQRVNTLNLAFAYFIQVCTKMKHLTENDLDMVVITCLLIASKLDEIDYNLPSFPYLIKHYGKSRHRIRSSSKLNAI